MVSESFRFKDIIEVYPVKDGVIDFNNKILETNNNPSILQRLLCKFGLYHYANDILMNEGLSYIASLIYDEFNYIGVGTDGTNPSVTTYHDLLSPVMARVLATKSIETTYVADDTVQFISIFTPGSSYTIMEAGIFKELTTSVTDIMLCRQTTNWSVTAGQSFAMVYKVICARS